MSRQLMRVKLSRKSWIVTVSIAFLVIATSAWIVSILKNRPVAFQETVSDAPTITIKITEGGVPGIGLAYFGGDCQDDPIASQDGSFSCTLKRTTGVTGDPYKIEGIAYQSFNLKKLIQLPLNQGADAQPELTVPSSAVLILSADIQNDGGVVLKKISQGVTVPLPVNTGLGE